MRKPKDPLSLLTIFLDKAQRSLRGIYEFSSDPECVYRLSIEKAPRDVVLPDGTELHKGEPVGIIHLWGEHMPVIPSSGINLAWASRMARVLEKSAGLLAQHAVRETSLQSIPAFGNDVFLPPSSVRLLERIGYAVLEGTSRHTLCGRLRIWIVRRWTWLLRRAFNRESARGIAPADLQYISIWISRRALFKKYGDSSGVGSA